jgi:hypothetical protein
MSENLDLVRSIYADWERGDLGSTERRIPRSRFFGLMAPCPARWLALLT